MTRFSKALIVMFVATFGLWGCAQGPTDGPANLERIRALETKNAKLEEDYRSAATTRDQLRKKLADVETQRNQLTEQLQAAQREREDLKQQLASRTNERNALQTQYEQFRTTLRDLLGRAEANLQGPPELPAATTAATLSSSANAPQ